MSTCFQCRTEISLERPIFEDSKSDGWWLVSFFLLRSSWLRKCTQVWKDEEEKSALNPRYHPDARARQKAHKAACSRSTHQPNLPSQYLDGSRSHFDVRRFRTLWEQDGGFASTDLIKRSASLREKLPSGEKFQLRRGLCDKLVELDVVK